MLAYTMQKSKINNRIFIPKYYDPLLRNELEALKNTHYLPTIGELIDAKILSVSTGDEIGKMAYGTGDIPFIRTSDIVNWEIKAIPKQGVSYEIYQQYAAREDVKVGDILLVKDGTYLIGTNCFITELDIPMIFQSHILKFRVDKQKMLSPYLFFAAINNGLVQRQIRNIQFTADIIDTIGNRYQEIIIPLPKSVKVQEQIVKRVKTALDTRIREKATIKQFPVLMEDILKTGKLDNLYSFLSLKTDKVKNKLTQDTMALELGNTVFFNVCSCDIKNKIFLPKYYDPTIKQELSLLTEVCELKSIQELINEKIIDIVTGDEIGKSAYGTGDIPFVRTSDFSNWELKFEAKQGVSCEIYEDYASKQDVKERDILLVRDGTYLVGSSCIITESDTKMLFCGGLFKIRAMVPEYLSPYLLLGLLNSYIVKRQIRTKQFTRDVIDTLGQRLYEIYLPIPKSDFIKQTISSEIERIIADRIVTRNIIAEMAAQITDK